MNTVDDWENIKYFMALARTGSLKGAAKLIKSNHTTVYRRVKQFEELYKVTLFDRTPKGYFLTTQGEQFLKRITGLDEKMDQIFSSLQGLEDKLSGVIKLTSTPSIAEVFLAEFISEFKKIAPEVQLELKVSNRFYSLVDGDADIAVRPATQVPDHLIGRNLGKINFALFSAKKDTNVLLANRKIICLDENFNHLLSKKWVLNNISKENIILKADSMNLVGQLCAKGFGDAILPKYYTLLYRNLNIVYEPEDFVGNNLWILTHKNVRNLPKIKACTDFLYQFFQKKIDPYLYE